MDTGEAESARWRRNPAAATGVRTRRVQYTLGTMKNMFAAAVVVMLAGIASVFAAPDASTNGQAAAPQAGSAAQDTNASKRPVTIDDVLAIKAVGAPAVSPDGTHVIYTVRA